MNTDMGFSSFLRLFSLTLVPGCCRSYVVCWLCIVVKGIQRGGSLVHII